MTHGSRAKTSRFRRMMKYNPRVQNDRRGCSKSIRVDIVCRYGMVREDRSTSVQCQQGGRFKATYESYEKALLASNELTRHAGSDVTRPYECRECGFWHLTSSAVR